MEQEMTTSVVEENMTTTSHGTTDSAPTINNEPPVSVDDPGSPVVDVLKTYHGCDEGGVEGGDEDEDEPDADGEVYEVEYIIDSRESEQGPVYLIKWKGWSARHNTWEPESNIFDKVLRPLQKTGEAPQPSYFDHYAQELIEQHLQRKKEHQAKLQEKAAAKLAAMNPVVSSAELLNDFETNWLANWTREAPDISTYPSLHLFPSPQVLWLVDMC